MMYANRKGPGPPQSPSDSQAKEKLAVFVYEYLVHVGSKGAAEMFLKEINWTKNITLGPDPGFLTSWWNVFWDLYSAAPERREQCDHSTEAKAFHDYGFVNSGFPLVNGMHGPNATPSPLGMPPPQPTPDGMPPGAVPPGMAGPGGPHPGFFGPGGVPVRPSQTGPAGVSQASPHSAPLSGMAPGQPGFPPVVLARLPGQRPFRLPQEAGMPPFSGAGMFPPDPQQIRPGPGHMMGQRLPPSAGPHPRMPATPAINNFGMRPPHGAPMPRPWLPSTSAMHYSEPSSSVSTGPFPFQGAPIMSNGPVPGGPSTPIMPSPQNMAPGDGSIPERYNMMPGGGPGLPPSFSMGNDSSMGGTGGPPSEMMMNGDTMDIKNSPASSQGLNGGTPGPPPATGPSSVPPQPGQPGSSESMDYSSSVNPFPQENEQSEIAKIKQSMMEESKQFESKSSEDGGSNDFPFAGI